MGPRIWFFGVLLVAFLSASCTQNVGNEELKAACKTRMHTISTAPDERIDTFCGCFAPLAAAKVGRERLREALKAGDRQVMNETQDAYKQCTATKIEITITPNR